MLEPLFERRFIDDSYACRRGKGTHRAIDRAQRFQRQYRFVLKTDIVRFFPNVDHEVLLALLGKTIRDERLTELIRRIIASGEGILDDEATPSRFPGDDLFSTLRPTGLPIGNLTSQFFANALLDPIDHYIKEQLSVPGYVRHADDLLLFADSKQTLWDAAGRLKQRLALLRLRLHRDKTTVRPTTHWLTFLGMKLKPHHRRLSQTALRRFNRRLRRQQSLYRQHRISLSSIRDSLRAFQAHCDSANSFSIFCKLLSRAKFRRR